MNLAADDLSIDQTYRLMTGMIVPRPIAWVTTRSSAGTVNLAPFSAFTFLSTKPPIIGISITRRAGALKDTARNIEETGEFVVNIADDTFLDAVHASSAEYPPDVSEPGVLGLTLVPSRSVAAPRLADVPAAMECRLERTIEFVTWGPAFSPEQCFIFTSGTACWSTERLPPSTCARSAVLPDPDTPA